jgi:hypothetical protein
MGKGSKTKVNPSARKEVKNEELKTNNVEPSERVSKEIIAEHLPPIGLVFTVIACSGFLLVFSFRDMFATGKVIGGAMDGAMQVSYVMLCYVM